MPSRRSRARQSIDSDGNGKRARLDNAAAPEAHVDSPAPTDPPQVESTSGGDGVPHSSAVNGISHPSTVREHQPVSIDNAAAQLHEILKGSVSMDAARNALLETKDSSGDITRWLEAAQDYLATMDALEQENEDMKKAMEESLVMHEVAKVAAPELWELSTDDLQAKFCKSALLAKLSSLVVETVLWGETVKRALVELLSLEKKCTCQWYCGAGSQRFFDQLAEALAADIQAAASPATSDAGPSGSGDHTTAPTNSNGSSKAAAEDKNNLASSSRQAQSGASGREASGQSATGQETVAIVAEDLKKILVERFEKLREEVCKMPDPKSQLPAIFQLPEGERGTQGEADEDDDVEVMDVPSPPPPEVESLTVY